MSTLYLTGFTDFSAPKSTGLLSNPSRLLIQHIENTPGSKEALAELGGYANVITTLTEVPQGDNFEALAKISKTSAGKILSALTNTDAIISFGQGRFTQRAPVIEGRFENTLNWGALGSSAIDTNQALNHSVGQGDGLGKLVQDLEVMYPGLSLGTNAGNFLCNLWGYMAHEAAPGRSLFVHLPGCSDRLIAEKLWAANEAKFRETGLSYASEMGAPSVEDNFGFLKKLVSTWRSFKTKSI